jgi:pyruvate dehydrogenase E2 component (dihydrolipoamide acetyltransferase)
VSARITPVTIPKWGLEMTEGTIAAWLKPEGSAVAPGEPIAEIESEKIVNSLDAPAGGILKRIVRAESTVAAVGDLIALIADESVGDAELDAFLARYAAPRRDAVTGPSSGTDTGAAPVAPVAPVAPARTAAATTATNPGPAAGHVRISPPVRRLAAERGLSLEGLRGSGRGGRILLADIERRATAGTAAETVRPASPARSAPLSAARRTIARRMQAAAAQVPHFYLSAEIDASALLERRRQLRADGTDVSVNDLLVHAVARALCLHPDVNARLEGDVLHQFDDAHVAVAMAARGSLVAPVLHFANRLDEAGAGAALRALRAQAEGGTLTRDALEGATFTLSNLGMHRIRQFTAIITPPQCAALAVGRIEEQPGASGRWTPRTIVTLSCDHRVLDGVAGARFLESLSEACTTWPTSP